MQERESRLIAAVHLATMKLSSSTSVSETLRDVLELCVEAVDAGGGTIYLHDPVKRKLEFLYVIPEEVRDLLPYTEIPDDFGAAGQALQNQRALITSPQNDPHRNVREHIEKAVKIETKTLLTAPLMIPGMQPFGVVQLVNCKQGDFRQQDLEVIEIVGAVSSLVYMNAILAEQAQKAASLMGMGKVSHDIGNLTAALSANFMIIEPMIDKFSTFTQHNDAEELREAVIDLKEGINRVVGYSRLISDLSAGRPLRPQVSPHCMAETVVEAVSYLEPEARRQGVEITYNVENDSEQTLFDPQFVFRIVQNLVGNAIKAVSETTSGNKRNQSSSSVCISLRRSQNEYIIEVEDTGPGMPEETVKRIIAGTAISQWSNSGGSGWGTKIVLDLVCALGGNIQVDSQIGKGTTFRVYLPYKPLTVATAT